MVTDYRDDHFTDFTPIGEHRLADLVKIAEKQFREVRGAYHRGEPGWTYDDMKQSAKRLLSIRRMYEKATGRQARSNPESKAQVAALMR